MKLSLKELIKRLQEQENPNLPHQETNVEDVQHSVRGLRLVTEEMNMANDALDQIRNPYRR